MMEIINKVKEAVNNSTFDVLMALGVANIQYISGVSAPILRNHDERPMLIIYHEIATYDTHLCRDFICVKHQTGGMSSSQDCRESISAARNPHI